MVWFFIVVTIVAIALFVVRAADQGRALAVAMVFSVIFFGCLALLSGITFGVAFLFGAIEKILLGPQEQTASPFISDRPPEQIIPPQSIDSE